MLVYDGALLCTVALTGWVALDIAIDPIRRRRLAAVGLLALAALCWASGELLLQHAGSPSERIAIRRLLFAGVCTLPAAWVWTALVAARPAEGLRRPRLMLALAAPGVLAYSCLFWDRAGWFLDWYAVPTQRGPLFFAFTAWAWTLIVAGTAVLMRATPRTSTGGRGLRVAIVVSALLPLSANLEHVLVHATVVDPTPATIGMAALVFRAVVLDLAFAAAQPRLARAEVVAQMGEGVLVADLAGRVVDWNAASEHILADAHLAARPLEPLLEDLRRKRGRDVEVRSFAIERNGRPFARAALLADRTELRHAEIRLELAARLEALGLLASGAAHEINNPLAYVSANLTLLERFVSALAGSKLVGALPPGLRDEVRQASQLLADCQEGTERIGQVVERLTEFGGTGALDTVPVELDVTVPVRKAVALAKLGRPGCRIELAAREALPRVLAEEHDVLHLVLHVLLNAFQMGGDEVPILVELGTRDGEVYVRVSDAGPGIPERDLPHVFDPFFTTRRPGPNLGLGLSVCWELARRNRGRLEAGPSSRGGAVFTLSLPVAES